VYDTLHIRIQGVLSNLRLRERAIAAASDWGAKNLTSAPVVAGQAVGIKEVQDGIWLVSFVDYDLGYFDLETRVLEPLENRFGPKVMA
jgi:putative transposase